MSQSGGSPGPGAGEAGAGDAGAGADPGEGGPEAGGAGDAGGAAGAAAVGSPHDRFFKALVSQPANAASLLADVLPAELADGLDLAQLRPAPTEYISEILARRDADLVFTVPQRGREMFVHLHVEHQLENDPLICTAVAA